MRFDTISGVNTDKSLVQWKGNSTIIKSNHHQKTDIILQNGSRTFHANDITHIRRSCKLTYAVGVCLNCQDAVRKNWQMNAGVTYNGKRRTKQSQRVGKVLQRETGEFRCELEILWWDVERVAVAYISRWYVRNRRTVPRSFAKCNKYVGKSAFG